MADGVSKRGRCRIPAGSTDQENRSLTRTWQKAIAPEPGTPDQDYRSSKAGIRLKRRSAPTMQLTETSVAIEILTWMWQVLYTEHQRTLTNLPTTPTDTTSRLTETDKRTRQTLHMCVPYKSGGMISGSRCAIESLNPTIQRAGVVSKTTNQFDDEGNNKKLTSGQSIRTTFQGWCFFPHSSKESWAPRMVAVLTQERVHCPRQFIILSCSRM